MFEVELSPPVLALHRAVPSTPPEKKLPPLKAVRKPSAAPPPKKRALPPVGARAVAPAAQHELQPSVPVRITPPRASDATRSLEGVESEGTSLGAAPSAAELPEAAAQSGGAAAAQQEETKPLPDAEHPPMWRVLKLDGLERFDERFEVCLADRSKARDLARVSGCCKKLVKLEGGEVAAPSESDILSLLGFPLRSLQSLRLLPAKGERLGEYGCSIAVTLYLRFQLETALLFLALFLLSVIQLADNHSRNDLRNRCRTALLTQHDALTAPAFSGSDRPWHAECGYASLHVRSDNISLVPSTFAVGVLTGSLGTCQEYSNKSDGILPVPFSDDGLFLDLPTGAGVCTGGSDVAELGYLLQFVAVLLVLLYLAYLKRLIHRVARFEENSMITTADYAVLLRGLADGMDATAARRTTAAQLRADLYADLREMGFGADAIVQIEVGRNCCEEIALLHRLERLNIQKHELAARALLRSQGKWVASSKASDDKAHLLLALELRATIARVQALYDAEDYATGHAFVVFREARERNRFLAMARAAPSGSRSSVAPRGVELRRAARAGVAPEVLGAPEPSEVYWESLEKDDAHERRALRLGGYVVGTLLVVGAAMIVASKALVAVDKQRPLAPGFSLLSTGLAATSAITTTLVNFVLHEASEKLTVWEGQDTQTEHEASLCRKVTLAYIANSVLIPTFLGIVFSWSVSGFPVDQSWYEEGGVLSQAWLLVIINGLSKDALKILMLPVRLHRYLLSRTVASQAKLNSLWRPPPMHVGELYAATIKTCALGLVYGPLCPYIYLMTCGALLFCYIATRNGIARWYLKPPAVDEGMMTSMRTSLSGVVATMVALQTMAILASTRGELGYGSATAVFGCPIAWLLYAFTPLDRFNAFVHREDAELGDVESQEGQLKYKYEDVMLHTGIEMVPYVCPKLTEKMMAALEEEKVYCQDVLDGRVSPDGQTSPAEKTPPADALNTCGIIKSAGDGPTPCPSTKPDDTTANSVLSATLDKNSTRPDASSEPSDKTTRQGGQSQLKNDSTRQGVSLKPDDNTARQGVSSKPNNSNSRQCLSLKPDNGNSRQSVHLKPEDITARQGASSKPHDSTASQSVSSKPEDNNTRQGASLKQDDNAARQGESSKPDDSTARQVVSSKPDDRSMRQGESSRPDDNPSTQGVSSKPEDNILRQDVSSKQDDSSTRQGETSSPDDNPSTQGVSSKPDDSTARQDVSSKQDDSSTRQGETSSPDDNPSTQGVSSRPDDSTARQDVSLKPDDGSARQGETSSPDDDPSRQGVSSTPDIGSTKQGDSSSPDFNTASQGVSSNPDDINASKVVESKPDDDTSRQGISSKPDDSTARQGISSKPGDCSTRQDETSSPNENTSRQDVSSKLDDSTARQSASSKTEDSSTKPGESSVLDKDGERQSENPKDEQQDVDETKYIEHSKQDEEGKRQGEVTRQDVHGTKPIVTSRQEVDGKKAVDEPSASLEVDSGPEPDVVSTRPESSNPNAEDTEAAANSRLDNDRVKSTDDTEHNDRLTSDDRAQPIDGMIEKDSASGVATP